MGSENQKAPRTKLGPVSSGVIVIVPCPNPPRAVESERRAFLSGFRSPNSIVLAIWLSGSFRRSPKRAPTANVHGFLATGSYCLDGRYVIPQPEFSDPFRVGSFTHRWAVSGDMKVVLTKGSTVADAADGGDGITRVARILMILLPDVMSMRKRGGRATRACMPSGRKVPAAYRSASADLIVACPSRSKRGLAK